jgi:hypothetical protein
LAKIRKLPDFDRASRAAILDPAGEKFFGMLDPYTDVNDDAWWFKLWHIKRQWYKEYLRHLKKYSMPERKSEQPRKERLPIPGWI